MWVCEDCEWRVVEFVTNNNGRRDPVDGHVWTDLLRLHHVRTDIDNHVAIGFDGGLADPEACSAVILEALQIWYFNFGVFDSGPYKSRP